MAEKTALMKLPWEKLVNAVKAHTISTKYSAGPKSIASLDSRGANRISKKIDRTPPENEATALIASACPARPCLASGLPSIQVTAADEVPGTLSRILEMELPYCEP